MLQAAPGLTARERARGCLLAGACGDALGGPVEFMRDGEIRARFGPGGIRDMAPAYGKLGAITDDTQMTLFTAEGLIRAHLRWLRRGVSEPAAVVRGAYLRWLLTQGERPRQATFPEDGWLLGLRALHDRRAPGNTCLSALNTPPGAGLVARNDSKGCGGVMRAAPAGLAASPERAFELGDLCAAITHGHPTGRLAAGFLAAAISGLSTGQALAAALDEAAALLRERPSHEETLRAVEAAREEAAAGRRESVPTRLAPLGGGWVAEEALAIGVWAVLAADDLEGAVVLAVNHGGDSDSTGSIAGNLAGTLLGEAAIPERWLDRLELRAEIAQVADDLVECGEIGADDPAYDRLFERYPGH
jgi:ADP-ribosylglycohydrolase